MKKQPRGVLLLLALVIMAIVLSAALVLGSVVVREIRLSAISDKGVNALYAAETAAEDAVYRMYKLGEDPSALPQSGSLSGGASWERNSRRTDTQFIYDLVGRDETVVVDLYNSANTNQAANAQSVTISWTSGTTLDVFVSEWDGTTLSSLSGLTCTSSPCVVNAPTPTRAYQLLLTAETTAMTDLTVSVFSSDGGAGSPVAVEIPVTVTATGVYQGAQQAVQLRLPVPAPWG
jgi:hypothetical protein